MITEVLRKHPGQPPKYKTPDEMWDKIVEYFEKETPEKVTITGLCLYLGFESRQSFYDYENREDGFSYIVKKGRMMIENEYEQIVKAKGHAGAIFALKQFGWKDKTTLEHTGDEDHPVTFKGIKID